MKNNQSEVNRVARKGIAMLDELSKKCFPKKEELSETEKQTSKDFEIRNNVLSKKLIGLKNESYLEPEKKESYSQFILRTWKVGTPLSRK